MSSGEQAPSLTKTALASSWFGWLISSIILVLVFHLQANQSTHPMAGQIVAVAVVLAVYALPVALVAAAFLGPAWYKHSAKRGYRKLWTHLFAGLVLGAGAGAIVSIAFLLLLGPAWWAWSRVGIPYSAAIGALSGLFMWLDLRPDRNAANPPTSNP